MALSTLRLQTSEEKSFSWTIPHFAAMRNLKEVVNAQEVTFEMGEAIGLPTKWKCFLQRNNNGDIGVFVQAVDIPIHLTALYANIQFSLKTDCCSRTYSTCPHFTWTLNENMADCFRHGFDAAFKKSAGSSLITQNGTLLWSVTVTLFNLGNSPQLPSLLAEHEVRFVAQLQVDLASIRSRRPDITNPRVTIVSMDGKEFAADPYILAARSPVFRSMFESKMREAESGVVKVDDMVSGSLDVLLEFCHSGVLKENWKEAGVVEGLLYGAGKYMLEDLKSFLGKAVVLVCTKENCGKLFSLSRALGMKEAEASLLEYFKRNMADDPEQIVAFAQDLELAAIPKQDST